MTDERTLLMPEQKTSAPAVKSSAQSNGEFSIANTKRFKLVRVLGRGAFGIVYLAEDRKLGRLVAIKQLFGSFSNNTEIRERFMLEARIAGQIAHPNIVIVYNIEETEGDPSIVMEYLGGGSLEQMLQAQSGRLDFMLSIRIMLGVLSGLGAAHNINVVHRDIKPQNIVFSIGSTPKITDFGIAQLPAGGLSDTRNIRLTDLEKTSIAGTPSYMSPEQIQGEHSDARTDLYSAGIIFYRMLSGRTLFSLSHENYNFEDIKKLVLESHPEHIGKFRKDIPREIDDIISKLLAKKIENRYPDAETAVKDILMMLSANSSKFNLDEFIFPCHQVSISPSAIIEDMLNILLADGKISPPERLELNKRVEKLGLSQAKLKAVEEKVRSELHLAPLKTVEKLERHIAGLILENNGQELDNSQMASIKYRQKELKISDSEASSILAYMTHKNFF